jgi:hypothetical protein
VVRLLRTSIAAEGSARGERVHELGKQARERINDNFNVDDPNTPLRASQKLIAAATLLRAMLAPSMPEARNLYREAQVVIEQAAVQQAESSASAYASRVVCETTAAPKAKRHASTRAARWGNQPTRAERRSGSGSLIRAGRPRTTTPTTSSMLAERATQRHGRRRATSLGGATATTAVRITHRRRNPREPVCSAGRSAQQASPSASASPPRLTSTQGRQTLVCGSTTTA